MLSICVLLRSVSQIVPNKVLHDWNRSSSKFNRYRRTCFQATFGQHLTEAFSPTEKNIMDNLQGLSVQPSVCWGSVYHTYSPIYITAIARRVSGMHAKESQYNYCGHKLLLEWKNFGSLRFFKTLAHKSICKSDVYYVHKQYADFTRESLQCLILKQDKI